MQKNVDNIIEDLACTLQVFRNDLHVVIIIQISKDYLLTFLKIGGQKGMIYSNYIEIELKNKTIIKPSDSALIPSIRNIKNINILNCHDKLLVLVIEKESTFQYLIQNLMTSNETVTKLNELILPSRSWCLITVKDILISIH